MILLLTLNRYVHTGQADNQYSQYALYFTFFVQNFVSEQPQLSLQSKIRSGGPEFHVNFTWNISRTLITGKDTTIKLLFKDWNRHAFTGQLNWSFKTRIFWPVFAFQICVVQSLDTETIRSLVIDQSKSIRQKGGRRSAI